MTFDEEVEEFAHENSERITQLRNTLNTQKADEVDTALEYGLDIGQGILAGAVDAADDTLNFLAKLTNAANLTEIERQRFLPETDRPVTGVGQFAEDISQFGVGLLGAGKFTTVTNGFLKANRFTRNIYSKVGHYMYTPFSKASQVKPIKALGETKLGKVAGKVVNKKTGKLTLDSAIASTVAHNPYDERLADLIARYPSFAQPIGEALAGDIDDSEFDLYMKMAIEDVALTATVGAALFTTTKTLVKVVKSLRKGDEAGAEQALKEGEKLLLENAKDEPLLLEYKPLLLGKSDTVFVPPKDDVINMPPPEKSMNDFLDTRQLKDINRKELDKKAKNNKANATTKETAEDVAETGATTKQTTDGVSEAGTTPKATTKDVSEAGTPPKAEVQETTVGKAADDAPKTDGSNKGLDTLKVTEEQATKLVQILKTAKGDEKSFDELQENVDSLLYNIIQTRKSAGQAEHISLYEDMDAFYSSIGRQVADLTKDAQLATKRTETFEELGSRVKENLKTMLDLTDDEIAALQAKHTKGVQDGYVFLASVDSLIRRQYDELLALANVADEAFDDTVKLSLLAEFEKFQRLIQGATGMRSELGRALNSRRMGIKSYDELTAAARKDQELNKLSPDAVRNIIRNSDIQGVAKATNHASRFQKGAGMAGEFFRSMILSNFKTQVTNTLSGFTETFLKPTERMIGSLFLTKSEGAVVRAEAMGTLAALKQASGDALSYAAASFKEERNILDPLRTTTENIQHKITAKYIGLDDTTPLGRFVDIVGKTSRLSLRALGSGDEFLKQMNYRAFIMGKATREGIEAGLNGDALDAFVAKKLSESFDDIGRGIDEDALRYAQEATFTEDLGKNIFANIQKMTVEYPAMQLLLPFVRTPTNLLKRAGQRTPVLAMLSKTVREDIKAGGVRKAEALGRQAMGFFVISSMLFAYSEGKVTGAGPTDKKLRKFNRETESGAQYSFRIGDKMYSYNRLDPNFIAVGAIVSALEALPSDFELDEMSLELASDMMAALFLGLTQTFKNKAYFQGVSNFLTAMQAEDDAGTRGVGRYGENFISSFVPPAIQQTTDLLTGQDALREAIGLADKLKKRGLFMAFGEGADTLPKQYNWLTGQPIKNHVGPNTLGFQAQNVTETPVMKELKAIGFGFTGPSKRISKQDLTTEQYAYYKQMTGQIRIDGRTLEQALDKLFKSREWQNLPPERKRYMENGKILTKELQKVSNIIADYKKMARQALGKKFPELQRDINEYNYTRRGIPSDILQSNR